MFRQASKRTWLSLSLRANSMSVSSSSLSERIDCSRIAASLCCHFGLPNKLKIINHHQKISIKQIFKILASGKTNITQYNTI